MLSRARSDRLAVLPGYSSPRQFADRVIVMITDNNLLVTLIFCFLRLLRSSVYLGMEIREGRLSLSVSETTLHFTVPSRSISAAALSVGSSTNTKMSGCTSYEDPEDYIRTDSRPALASNAIRKTGN